MASIYGHKWTGTYGEQEVGDTWSVGLADLTPEEIGNGLHGCLNRRDPWPPSLPEFRALCRPPKDKRENAAMYHCPPDRQLPHKLSDDAREKGRAAIAGMRKEL